MRLQLLKNRSISFLRNIHSNKTSSDVVTTTVTNAGYRGEVHKVQTDDGYVLNVHRVLPMKHSVQKGTAFLMHGLFRNSLDFIATGPKIALAYYLADQGYDVWLGNTRGSKFSREHRKHSLKSKEFWNFSFHEIGINDVRAMVDFMLDHTTETKTFYVGHSQGTCSLLALLSSLPSYNDKIVQAHLLTPAVFMRHSTSPMITLLAKQSKLVMRYANRLGRVNISPLLKASHKLCNMNGFSTDTAMKLYENFTCSMVGRNKGETLIAEEALRNFHDFMSPEVSMMQLTHFLQLHLSGKFCQFDHGEHNQQHYNVSHPPDYELHKVTAPMYLYSASEDILTSPKDAEHLKTKLPNVKNSKVIHNWNHMDVMLGRSSREILYKDILRTMNAAH